MNCLQRAFCYISRKRLKSLLLFLIFMVVNCMVLGILGMQSASEEVMKELRSNTEGTRLGKPVVVGAGRNPGTDTSYRG